jgi:mRNA interferase MazF
MPIFERGQTVRVPFRYTDRSTRQRRPALVVSSGAIGAADSLLWVVMITSAENRPWPGDIPLGDDLALAGLSAASVIRPCKIATVEAGEVEALGRVGAGVMSRVSETVRGYLGAAALIADGAVGEDAAPPT